MTTLKFDFKHSAGENSRDRALDLHGLGLIGLRPVFRPLAEPALSTTPRAASSSTKISWLSDNENGFAATDSSCWGALCNFDHAIATGKIERPFTL